MRALTATVIGLGILALGSGIVQGVLGSHPNWMPRI